MLLYADVTSLCLGPKNAIKLQVPAVLGHVGPSAGRTRDHEYPWMAADHADHAQDLGASNWKC